MCDRSAKSSRAGERLYLGYVSLLRFSRRLSLSSRRLDAAALNRHKGEVQIVINLAELRRMFRSDRAINSFVVLVMFGDLALPFVQQIPGFVSWHVEQSRNGDRVAFVQI